MAIIKYSGHQENNGDLAAVDSGVFLGSQGKGLRLENIKVWLEDLNGEDLHIMARGHVQNKGWIDPVVDGGMCGSQGEGLRLEAFQLKLTGADAEKYSIIYQAHVQDLGFTNYARDGELCGTTDGSKRIEGVIVYLVPAGTIIQVDNENHFIQYEKQKPVADIGGFLPMVSGHVFLAIAHGTQTNGVWDSGAVWGDYHESDISFGIGGYAVKRMRERGLLVDTDYDTGNDRNITYTVRDANALGVDAYVSLHCDWSGAPSGTLPIVYADSVAGLKLAECINKSVMRDVGIGTRGIVKQADADADYEVKGTVMEACIFEMGSMKADIDKLLDFEIYGLAVADGICDYFEQYFN